MPDYGIAFAGGGARGAAHVGVLLALEEEGLLPGCAAGTSSGGIVAGIYGAEIEISQMKEVVQWMARHGKRLLDPDIIGLFALLPQLFLGRELSLTGLLKGNRISDFLCRLTDGAAIESLNRRLLIPAVDINSGNTIVFTNLMENGMTDSARRLENVKWERKGPLCEIMMASASVPAVFRPRRINGYCMVDGGVTNNLPVDLLICAGMKKVVAVDIGADYKMPHDRSIVEIASHSFSIMSRDLKACRSSGEMLLLRPELKQGAGLLTFEYMESCMQEGYAYTKRQMDLIGRALAG